MSTADRHPIPAPAKPADTIPPQDCGTDGIDDAEMNEEIERPRREAAGEPPLPVKPGPRRIYKYQPDDDALTWVPDERAGRKYPGWENMTKPERREFFG